MPNVMVALPNIGGALCSTPQSLADAQGVIKPLFCVLEDELLSASDELLRETGQPHHVVCSQLHITRMWANAQPDGRPAEHRWRPLFNAAKFS